MFMRPTMVEYRSPPLPSPVDNPDRRNVIQSPTTLQQIDPQGTLGFEIGMSLARASNQAHLGGHYGTHLPPNQRNDGRPAPVISRTRPKSIAPSHVRDFPVLTRPRTASPVRPPPAIAPVPVVNQALSRAVPPASPVTPKPGTPPPFRPPYLPVNQAHRENDRIIASLLRRYRPNLRPVADLSNHLLAPSRRTRTGLINPLLPDVEESLSSSSSSPIHAVTHDT